MKSLKKEKGQSGEIMLESSIVLSITIIMIVCMIGLGFYIYQQAMVYTIAAETAENIGRNYKYTSTDIDEYSVDISKMTDLRMYRVYFKLQDIRKAESYAIERGSLTSFNSSDSVRVEECELIRDNVGRQHVKVTISLESSFLFGGILKACGFINNNSKLYATSYAECLDFTGYVSQVHFVDYLGDKADGTNVGKIYNNVNKMKDKIISIAEN